MVIDTLLDVKAQVRPGAAFLRKILTPSPTNVLCDSMVENKTLIREVFATNRRASGVHVLDLWKLEYN